MKRLAIAALALSLVAPAVGQAAQAGNEGTSVRVSYGDLNLTSSKDAALVLERLRTAALGACGASDFSLKDYRESVKRSGCYTASLDRAVTALSAPLVSALYEERSPVTVAGN